MPIDSHDMRKRLAEACAAAGSQAAWAKANGFSSAYICDVLSEKRDVSERLAAALGFTRKVAFYKGAA